MISLSCLHLCTLGGPFCAMKTWRRFFKEDAVLMLQGLEKDKMDWHVVEQVFAGLSFSSLVSLQGKRDMYIASKVLFVLISKHLCFSYISFSFFTTCENKVSDSFHACELL